MIHKKKDSLVPLMDEAELGSSGFTQDSESVCSTSGNQDSIRPCSSPTFLTRRYQKSATDLYVIVIIGVLSFQRDVFFGYAFSKQTVSGTITGLIMVLTRYFDSHMPLQNCVLLSMDRHQRVQARFPLWEND